MKVAAAWPPLLLLRPCRHASRVVLHTFDALPSQGRPGGSCFGVGVSHTRHSGQCRPVPWCIPLVAGASAHRTCRRVPTLLWEFAIQQVGCWRPQAGCEGRQREQWRRQQRWRQRQQKELSKRGNGSTAIKCSLRCLCWVRSAAVARPGHCPSSALTAALQVTICPLCCDCLLLAAHRSRHNTISAPPPPPPHTLSSTLHKLPTPTWPLDAPPPEGFWVPVCCAPTEY